MTKTDLLCPTCGKSPQKGGSMTQWIFDTSKCSCSNAGAAAIAPLLPRCALCGLRIRTNLGSITHWIFRMAVCECLVTNSTSEALNSDSLPNDDLIAGAPYEFLGVTGSGGVATVYKARNRKLGRFVAIKILQMGLDDSRAVQNFLREAKSASKLQHPNIVTVQDFGKMQDGRQFLVTEWIEGVTLAQYLHSKGPLTVEATQELFSQVLDGLSHAHNRAVVHRDIKPSNIMLARGGSGGWTVKIIDFGMAKEIDSEGLATRAEDIACSPFYMSPEQATQERVDARSDLYSVGCSIFEVLTGRTPFVGKALSVVMRHQLEDPPTLKQASGSEFPQSIEMLVAKLLAKDPLKRCQSADEAKAELRTIFSRRKQTAVSGFSAHASQSPQSGHRPITSTNRAFALAALVAATALTVVSAPHLLTLWKKPNPGVAKLEPARSAIFEEPLLNLVEKQVGSSSEKENSRIEPKEASTEGNSPETVHLQTQKNDEWHEWHWEGGKTWMSKHGASESDLIGVANLSGYEYITLWSEKKLTRKGLRALCTGTLRGVALGNTGLKPMMLEIVCGAPRLEWLYLDRNSNLTDKDLKPLSRLKNLRFLCLNDNNFSDDALKIVGQIRTCRILKLERMHRLRGAGLAYLETLKRLEALFLSQRLTNIGFKNLARLRTLKILSLEGTNLTDSDLANIKDLPLKKLDISNTNVTDYGLEMINSMKLSVLHAYGCKHLSRQALDRFKKENSQCWVDTSSWSAQSKPNPMLSDRI